MPGRKRPARPERKKCEDAVKELLKGLRYPISYDSHPLASNESVKVLMASAQVRTLPQSVSTAIGPEPTQGGEALLKALALLILDGIRIQVLQDNADELLTAGLIVTWFTYILPALQGTSPLALQEVIVFCTSLTNLKELVETAMSGSETQWQPDKLQWITGPFEKMSKANKKGAKSKSGNRTAENYRNKAILFLCRRIQQIAASLNVKIETLLPELAGAGSQMAQAPDIVSGDEAEWNKRLSKCLTDYRSYELEQIKASLDAQGRSPSLEWFLARQICSPTNKGEEAAAVIELADICRPGAWTAVLDYPCSGTTTALLWLSSRYCKAEEFEPIVLRLDAKEYSPRAAIGESPYQFLAQRIYGPGRDAFAQRQEFESTLREAQVVCLIDNLGRLSHEDQFRVGQWLQPFSGAVVIVSPGISDDDLASIGGKDATRVALAPLDKTQIERFLSSFASEHGLDFDQILAQHIVWRELPDIAQWPLGLAITCEQVNAHQSDCASIAARFVAELFSRDGKPTPQWSQKFLDSYPAFEVLTRIATVKYALYSNLKEDFSLDFTEERALAYLGSWENPPWLEAATLPLLVRTGLKSYQFLNREVVGFLVALDSIKGGSRCGPWSLPSISRGDVVGVANRHYFALLENGLVQPSG